MQKCLICGERIWLWQKTDANSKWHSRCQYSFRKGLAMGYNRGKEIIVEKKKFVPMELEDIRRDTATLH